MVEKISVRVFYELIVEDEFEFETDGNVPVAGILVDLLANEKLRTLRVTDTSGKTYALGPSRMFIKDMDIYGEHVCDHIQGGD